MRNVLFYRLIIFNLIVAVWLAGTDITSGWMRAYIAHDSSKVTYLIIGAFLVMLYCVFRKAVDLNRGIDAHYEYIQSAAGWMFTLGMIGTFIGLSISLSGVTLENLKDVSGIQEVAVKLMTGLKVEIAATVVGAVFGLWTEVNYAILAVSSYTIERASKVLDVDVAKVTS